ncbi:MAG: hypothetical protein COC11_00565 [Candidatus Neomarinimicrobiota bacterium]|nr:MAG: hypothetical protein COC11_00565 [Candidatus Neomarinimicrobiota bacterium]
MPWVGILLSAIIAIMFKDWATSLAKGLQFKWNPAFNEGDKVILDGAEGMIVKIGTRETVFSVYSKSGLIWRYVPNERIAYLKLEKVINPDLHLDSEEEKAKKLQKMIDVLQDKKIIENKKDIEQLKNGDIK